VYFIRMSYPNQSQDRDPRPVSARPPSSQGEPIAASATYPGMPGWPQGFGAWQQYAASHYGPPGPPVVGPYGSNFVAPATIIQPQPVVSSATADRSEWGDAPFIEEYQGSGPGVKAGQVFDQFQQLSESEKQTFLQLIGGLGYTIPATANAAGTAARAAEGANAPNLRQLDGDQPVPAGYTRDPATGKIYRLSAPKERSGEWIRLNDEYDRLRGQLAQQMQDRRWVYNVETGHTVSHDGRPIDPADIPEEITRLRGEIATAKQRLKDYKGNHPEEFRETANPGRGRGRGARVPTVGIPARGRGRG
jgi:hypothetical protein